MFRTPVTHKFSITRLLAAGLLMGGLVVSADPVAPASKDQELRPRVARIFQELQRFAPLPGQARLRIEADAELVLARAGRDNTVTLTQQAVELCYRLPTPADGDACIAFVLGHELAHLSLHGPYLEADLFPPGATVSGLAPRVRRHLEHSADRWGFLYATMAGYPVEALLDLDGQGRDIFGYFQRILGGDLSGGHYPEPDQRAATIRAVFEALHSKSSLFRFGTVAAFFGDCETAVQLLVTLQEEFDTPEVRANRAYCELRDIVEAVTASGMEPALCLRPMVGMQSPLIRTTGRRGNPPTSVAQLREQLRPVHRSFHEITEDNPHHLSAWVNQAIASFLAGYHARAEHEIIQARNVLSDGRAVFPYLETTVGEVDLTLLAQELDSMVWLIKAREHEADLPRAIEAMSALAAQAPVPGIASFNLAALLERAGQTERAAALWSALRADPHALPGHCRWIAEGMQAPEDEPAPLVLPYTLPEPLNASDPEQHFELIYFPGDRWARIKDRLEALAWTATTVPAAVPTAEETPIISFLSHRDGAEALRRDHEITFLVLRDQPGQDLGQRRDLTQWCPGASPFPVSLGEVWDCRGIWASWVVDGEIREVWLDLRSL